jgi:hypothetical protein
MRTGTSLAALVTLLSLTACASSNTAHVITGVPANFNSANNALSSAVAQLNTDLSAETTDANSGAGDSAGPCYNLTANVDYDVKTTISHDAQTVAYDASNLQYAITTVRQDISNLVNDVTAIANEGATPPQGDLNTFIASTNTEILQVVAKANTEIDQANSDVASAYNTANALATNSCSGDGPGSAPGPIAHVS